MSELRYYVSPTNVLHPLFPSEITPEGCPEFTTREQAEQCIAERKAAENNTINLFPTEDSDAI